MHSASDGFLNIENFPPSLFFNRLKTQDWNHNLQTRKSCDENGTSAVCWTTNGNQIIPGLFSSKQHNINTQDSTQAPRGPERMFLILLTQNTRRLSMSSPPGVSALCTVTMFSSPLPPANWVLHAGSLSSPTSSPSLSSPAATQKGATPHWGAIRGSRLIGETIAVGASAERRLFSVFLWQ